MLSRKRIKKILNSFLGLSNNSNQELFRFPKGVYPIGKTTDNDVFIVGFPKSGNTLMQHILGYLYYGLNENTSGSLVNVLVPDIYVNSHYFRFNEVSFFKSHDLPKPEYKKVIYIMRDGREALLSYYHMMKNMNKKVTLKGLYEGSEKIFGTTWDEHITCWEKNPYQAEILWLRYEDLIKNKELELYKICKFLNIERTSEELQTVAKYTSFDYMQKVEEKKDWSVMKEGLFRKGARFVRKGELDSYKKEVDSKLISLFERQSSKSLKKYYS